jgi:hypothetical protein
MSLTARRRARAEVSLEDPTMAISKSRGIMSLFDEEGVGHPRLLRASERAPGAVTQARDRVPARRQRHGHRLRADEGEARHDPLRTSAPAPVARDRVPSGEHDVVRARRVANRDRVLTAPEVINFPACPIPQFDLQAGPGPDKQAIRLARGGRSERRSERDCGHPNSGQSARAARPCRPAERLLRLRIADAGNQR